MQGAHLPSRLISSSSCPRQSTLASTGENCLATYVATPAALGVSAELYKRRLLLLQYDLG